MFTGGKLHEYCVLSRRRAPKPFVRFSLLRKIASHLRVACDSHLVVGCAHQGTPLTHENCCDCSFELTALAFPSTECGSSDHADQPTVNHIQIVKRDQDSEERDYSGEGKCEPIVYFRS